jgi:hypothetical protein
LEKKEGKLLQSNVERVITPGDCFENIPFFQEYQVGTFALGDYKKKMPCQRTF